jgi:hypothetical protein
VEGRRIEVNPATAKATPRAPTLALRRHKSVAEEQELVEAHTRLAEAQLAVLRMQHCIQFQQVQRPTNDRSALATNMRRLRGEGLQDGLLLLLRGTILASQKAA